MADNETVPPDLQPVAHPKPPSSMLRIFLRGLAVSLPAVLTIVIAIWVANFLNVYIIQPASFSVQFLISLVVDESVQSATVNHLEAAPPLEYCESSYRVTEDLEQKYERFLQTNSKVPQDQNEWNAQRERRIQWMEVQARTVPTPVYVPLGQNAVPYDVYAIVAQSQPPGQIPKSSRGIYMEYVALRYFGSAFLLSTLTIALIVMMLYFIGRFVSARIGSWIVRTFEEQVLGRLPLIRNVYGSVKQVTDFVFSENQPLAYRGVAAVQYPSKDIWTIGFVTGESMRELAYAAKEPCVAVLIPTSPMPMTGFTINVPVSQLVELDLTIEQAMQFCISCGVLTPKHQKLSPQMHLELIKNKHVAESLGKNLSPETTPADNGDQ